MPQDLAALEWVAEALFELDGIEEREAASQSEHALGIGRCV